MQIIRKFDLTAKRGKAFPVHAAKAYGGNRGVVLLTINLGCSQQTPADLTFPHPPKKIPMPIV